MFLNDAGFGRADSSGEFVGGGGTHSAHRAEFADKGLAGGRPNSWDLIKQDRR
jgi:hypothetical protein